MPPVPIVSFSDERRADRQEFRAMFIVRRPPPPPAQEVVIVLLLEVVARRFAAGMKGDLDADVVRTPLAVIHGDAHRHMGGALARYGFLVAVDRADRVQEIPTHARRDWYDAIEVSSIQRRECTARPLRISGASPDEPTSCRASMTRPDASHVG